MHHLAPSTGPQHQWYQLLHSKRNGNPPLWTQRWGCMFLNHEAGLPSLCSDLFLLTTVTLEWDLPWELARQSALPHINGPLGTLECFPHFQIFPTPCISVLLSRRAESIHQTAQTLECGTGPGTRARATGSREDHTPSSLGFFFSLAR